MINIFSKKKILFLLIILTISYFTLNFFFKKFSEESSIELSYAQQYLYNGMVDKALNENNIDPFHLGFLGILYKYPFTKSGNISKFYSGICYYKLGKYKKCIKIMDKFYVQDKILSSIKYGVIGDSLIQINNDKKAIDYYIKAANINENEITTPLYYYKIAIIFFSKKLYKQSKFFLEKTKKYSSFLYKEDVEKYISFIENKI